MRDLTGIEKESGVAKARNDASNVETFVLVGRKLNGHCAVGVHSSDSIGTGQRWLEFVGKIKVISFVDLNLDR